MSVLVTGASGVVGLHVVRELAMLGSNVVGFSTTGAPPHAELVLGDAASRVRFEKGDVLDLDALRRVVAGLDVDGIVHAAALTGEAQAQQRTLDVVTLNIVGTANVLELARQAKMRRVVYLGSASEYGRRPDLRPILEDEANPEGMYAETKFLGHRLGQRYRELFDLEVVTVRVSSAYGPNTRFNPFRRLVGNTLLARLCRAVAFDEEVALEGGGDYPRDWTYAADTASGIALAYLAETPRHAVYNIACGQSYVLSEVVEALRRVAPEGKVTASSGQWDEDPYQALNLRGPLDVSRAMSDLGFRCRYDLESGLREYIAWWRAVRSASNTTKHARFHQFDEASPEVASNNQ